MASSGNVSEGKTKKLHESHLQIRFLNKTSVLKEPEASTKQNYKLFYATIL